MIKTGLDPILVNPTQPFDFENPPILPAVLAEQMIKTMNDHNAIGLAANQIGIPYSVFVMRGLDTNYVCFNPRIVYYSDEHETLDEACLSFPGVVAKIKRAKQIRVRFSTPTNQVATLVFEGLTARTFQHELDHLNGILFYNRANRYHREKALKNVRKRA